MLSEHDVVESATVRELREARRNDRAEEYRRERRGQSRYLAEIPACRSFGPLRPIVNLQGEVIDVECNLHPFGPKRRKYRMATDDEEDVDE